MYILGIFRKISSSVRIIQLQWLNGLYGHNEWKQSILYVLDRIADLWESDSNFNSLYGQEYAKFRLESETLTCKQIIFIASLIIPSYFHYIPLHTLHNIIIVIVAAFLMMLALSRDSCFENLIKWNSGSAEGTKACWDASHNAQKIAMCTSEIKNNKNNNIMDVTKVIIHV
jgi:hypothetical protein